MKNYWLNEDEWTPGSHLALWEVDDGEQWWYSAAYKEDALKMYLEPFLPTGISDLSKIDEEYLPCPIAEIEINRVDDDANLPIRQEETGKVVTKTAKEWAAEGAGPVASTVY